MADMRKRILGITAILFAALAVTGIGEIVASKIRRNGQFAHDAAANVDPAQIKESKCYLGDTTACRQLCAEDKRHSCEPPKPTAVEPVSKAEPAVGEEGTAKNLQRISGSRRYYGCTDKEVFNQLVRYGVQGDRKPWEQLLTSSVAVGICTHFEPGEPVFLMEVSLLAGMIKVRRTGDLHEFWTFLEAVP
jgi:hypothetical protein